MNTDTLESLTQERHVIDRDIKNNAKSTAIVSAATGFAVVGACSTFMPVNLELVSNVSASLMASIGTIHVLNDLKSAKAIESLRVQRNEIIKNSDIPQTPKPSKLSRTLGVCRIVRDGVFYSSSAIVTSLATYGVCSLVGINK